MPFLLNEIAVAQPEWIDLPAHFIKQRELAIQGIVLHDTAGTGTHADTQYLAGANSRQVSVDFTVERDGKIYKLNPDLSVFKCNHAGRSTQWKHYTNSQVNHATVGIEIVQKDDLSLVPLYTDIQVQSTAHLCAWLSSHFSLPATDITTHRNIITDGSRSDPRRFPFDGEVGFWSKYWGYMRPDNSFIRSLSGAEEEADHSEEEPLPRANLLASLSGPEQFISSVGVEAISSQTRYGVPAAVSIAQAALETGWGRYLPVDKFSGVRSFNLFGIKYSGQGEFVVSDTKEYVGGRWITVEAKFRKYASYSESFEGHALLLSQSSRYQSAMAMKHEPKKFARELQKGGYATDPNYAGTLIKIMDGYHLITRFPPPPAP
ncbi:MAG: glucosaminidase domain-containing protein [Vulcanimicrobiota bacterium]